MSEQNPEPAELDEREPVDEQPTAPAGTEKYYAVYDLTHLKYVLGSNSDTAAKARKFAKDAGIENFEIREV